MLALPFLDGAAASSLRSRKTGLWKVLASEPTAASVDKSQFAGMVRGLGKGSDLSDEGINSWVSFSLLMAFPYSHQPYFI
jgi:hypothetical protein